MVEQKMVLKVTMEDPKKRSKALQIATRFMGVISASLDGDKITVVGHGVDAVALTTALRKRFCAELINVAPVEAKKVEKKEEKKEEKQPLPYHNFAVVQPPYPYVVQESSYDPCRIM